MRHPEENPGFLVDQQPRTVAATPGKKVVTAFEFSRLCLFIIELFYPAALANDLDTSLYRYHFQHVKGALSLDIRRYAPVKGTATTIDNPLAVDIRDYASITREQSLGRTHFGT